MRPRRVRNDLRCARRSAPCCYGRSPASCGRSRTASLRWRGVRDSGGGCEEHAHPHREVPGDVAVEWPNALRRRREVGAGRIAFVRLTSFSICSPFRVRFSVRTGLSATNRIQTHPVGGSVTVSFLGGFGASGIATATAPAPLATAVAPGQSPKPEPSTQKEWPCRCHGCCSFTPGTAQSPAEVERSGSEVQAEAYRSRWKVLSPVTVPWATPRARQPVSPCRTQLLRSCCKKLCPSAQSAGLHLGSHRSALLRFGG